MSPDCEFLMKAYQCERTEISDIYRHFRVTSRNPVDQTENDKNIEMFQTIQLVLLRYKISRS